MSKWLAQRITDYGNPDSIAFRLRQKRIGPLMSMLREEHAKHGHVRMLDIGGTPVYWNIVNRGILEELDVSITLINLYALNLRAEDSIFTAMEADGCDLSRFANNEFHIAHSNSVLEHVGGWDRMQRFATEIRRVARRHFVQTPYFWFPVEPHAMLPFFHWLPKPARIALVQNFSLGHWRRRRVRAEANQLLRDNQMLNKREFRRLFPESRLVFERLFGLPKSMLAIL